MNENKECHFDVIGSKYIFNQLRPLTIPSYPHKLSHLIPVAVPGIFSRVFLNKHKLHNLIKRKFYILTTTTTIKKTMQIHKVLQHKTCGVQLWLLLVLLNRDEQR